MQANKANQAELESPVFITVGWACDGYRAATALRSPFQSAYWQGVSRLKSSEFSHHLQLRTEKTMRIVTWNCQGAFRRKAKLIANYKPDIAIIQECEAPEKLQFTKDVSAPYAQLWFGDNRNKGLGVFSYTDLEFEPCSIYDDSIRYCVPIEVKGRFNLNLIAIWAMGHSNTRFSYIGQVYLAVEKYRPFIRQTETMLIGDFNSNKQWDSTTKVGGGNHSKVVELLANEQIISVYHEYFGEQQGAESQNTLYMYRKQDKGYHIDYCFVPKGWMRRVKSVTVGAYEQWSTLSDHSPVFVEFTT